MAPMLGKTCVIGTNLWNQKIFIFIKTEYTSNASSNFSVAFFSRGRVMFCEIYAQLKASKILACAVQNPDKCPGRGADRCGKKNHSTPF